MCTLLLQNLVINDLLTRYLEHCVSTVRITLLPLNLVSAPLAPSVTQD